MAYGITYHGESTTILAAALAFVDDQPSRWIIHIEHEGGAVTGAIAELNIEGEMVTIADHDDEDRATGAETTIDFNDIHELEVF